jgi:NAD(P)-dependent dehydrogenase (short-subunit alcohol dehydrogenase family)
MSAFADKAAIVTGGASGIGRALGQELARRGARVVLADINGQSAQAAADAMTTAGGRARAAALDVRDADAVQRLVTETAATDGRLDYMFNNAGIALAGKTRDMTLADWNRLIDVNLRGVVHGVVAAYPVMIAQGFGHIVNTASAAGITPTPGLTGYATTKHAVVGLSTSLRGEAARHGVRVSVLCPGLIDTPIKDNMTLLNTDRQALLKSIPIKLHPVRGGAQPGDHRRHRLRQDRLAALPFVPGADGTSDRAQRAAQSYARGMRRRRGGSTWIYARTSRGSSRAAPISMDAVRTLATHPSTTASTTSSRFGSKVI